MTMMMMMMMMMMINIWLRMIDDLSMDAKFHDFAERDRQTDQWTDGAMDGRSNGWTETLAYWDAMDASKNAGKVCRFENFFTAEELFVMVKYLCCQLRSGALSRRRVW